MAEIIHDKRESNKCFVIDILEDWDILPGAISYWMGYLLHRDDGPAYIYKNEGEPKSRRLYCQYGLLHRDEYPAYSYYGGSPWDIHEIHYKLGKLHSEKFPAVCYMDGVAEYWLDDREVTEDDWVNITKN